MPFFFHSCVGYNFNLLTFYSSPIECHQDSFFKELYYHFSISYRLAHKFYTILEKQWRLKNFPYDFKILFFFRSVYVWILSMFAHLCVNCNKSLFSIRKFSGYNIFLYFPYSRNERENIADVCFKCFNRTLCGINLQFRLILS